MAISFQSYADLGDNGGAGTSLTVAFTTSSNANRCLVVWTSTGELTSNISVTYNGVTFLGPFASDTQWQGAFWVLLNPASGTNNIVITNTNSVTDFIGARCLEYDNVQRAAAPDNSGFTTDSTFHASYTSSFTPSHNNDLLVVGAQDDNITGFTPSISAPFTTRGGNISGSGVIFGDVVVASGAQSCTTTFSGSATSPSTHFFLTLIAAPQWGFEEESLVRRMPRRVAWHPYLQARDNIEGLPFTAVKTPLTWPDIDEPPKLRRRVAWRSGPDQTAIDEFLKNPTQTAFVPWGFEEELLQRRVPRRYVWRAYSQALLDEFLNNPTQTAFVPWGFEEEPQHRVPRRYIWRAYSQALLDEFLKNPTQTAFVPWGFEEEPQHRVPRRVVWRSRIRLADDEGWIFFIPSLVVVSGSITGPLGGAPLGALPLGSVGLGTILTINFQLGSEKINLVNFQTSAFTDSISPFILNSFTTSDVLAAANPVIFVPAEYLASQMQDVHSFMDWSGQVLSGSYLIEWGGALSFTTNFRSSEWVATPIYLLSRPTEWTGDLSFSWNNLSELNSGLQQDSSISSELIGAAQALQVPFEWSSTVLMSNIKPLEELEAVLLSASGQTESLSAGLLTQMTLAEVLASQQQDALVLFETSLFIVNTSLLVEMLTSNVVNFGVPIEDILSAAQNVGAAGSWLGVLIGSAPLPSESSSGGFTTNSLIPLDAVLAILDSSLSPQELLQTVQKLQDAQVSFETIGAFPLNIGLPQATLVLARVDKVQQSELTAAQSTPLFSSVETVSGLRVDALALDDDRATIFTQDTTFSTEIVARQTSDDTIFDETLTIQLSSQFVSLLCESLAVGLNNLTTSTETVVGLSLDESALFSSGGALQLDTVALDDAGSSVQRSDALPIEFLTATVMFFSRTDGLLLVDITMNQVLNTVTPVETVSSQTLSYVALSEELSDQKVNIPPLTESVSFATVDGTLPADSVTNLLLSALSQADLPVLQQSDQPMLVESVSALRLNIVLPADSTVSSVVNHGLLVALLLGCVQDQKISIDTLKLQAASVQDGQVLIDFIGSIRQEGLPLVDETIGMVRVDSDSVSDSVASSSVDANGGTTDVMSLTLSTAPIVEEVLSVLQFVFNSDSTLQIEVIRSPIAVDGMTVVGRVRVRIVSRKNE